jgi:hypothetical protein
MHPEESHPGRGKPSRAAVSELEIDAAANDVRGIAALLIMKWIT